MTSVTARGPHGALMALGSLDIELHNVRQRTFYPRQGDSTTRYYLNGNRCSRKDALSRLSKFIQDDELLTYVGPLK